MKSFSSAFTTNKERQTLEFQGKTLIPGLILHSNHPFSWLSGRGSAQLLFWATLLVALMALSGCQGVPGEQSLEPTLLPSQTPTLPPTPTPTPTPSPTLTPTATATPTQTPTPTFTATATWPLADTGKLVFYANIKNKSGIYSMRPDGAELSFMTGGDYPTFSPDGERIAYLNAGDLYIMRRDGSAQRKIKLLGGLFPAFYDDNVLYDSKAVPLCMEWSADGQYLAVLIEQSANARRQIQLVDASGKNPIELYSFKRDENSTANCPTWSPVKNQIVFMIGQKVHTVGFQRVVFPDVFFTLEEDMVQATSIAWSPTDSFKMAIQSQIGLQILNPYGNEKITLANIHNFLAWSPDGTKIAYSDNGLWIANADGSGAVKISDLSPTMLDWGP